MAIIEYHVSWPGYDPFYNHNTVDNNGRKNFYNVSGVPYCKFDGYYNSTSQGAMENYYDYDTGQGSPCTISLFGEYDEDTNEGSYTVLVNTDEDLTTNDYRVLIALTEDPTVYGGNNYDTMRDMYPTYNGTPVDISGTAPKFAMVSGTFTADSTYVDANLRLVAFVQPFENHRKVLNATQSYLADLMPATDVADAPARFELGSNYPNPFNPSTTVPVEVKTDGSALVEVITADGRRVRLLHEGMLDAGSHEFVWDGMDEAGHPMASGVYMVRLVGATDRLTERMVLLK